MSGFVGVPEVDGHHAERTVVTAVGKVPLEEAKACVLVLLGVRAPVLAVGDGALGFWKALREVLPETREQRCRVHETAKSRATALAIRPMATRLYGARRSAPQVRRGVTGYDMVNRGDLEVVRGSDCGASVCCRCWG